MDHFVGKLVEALIVNVFVKIIERFGAPDYAAEVAHSLLAGLGSRKRLRLLRLALFAAMKVRPRRLADKASRPYRYFLQVFVGWLTASMVFVSIVPFVSAVIFAQWRRGASAPIAAVMALCGLFLGYKLIHSVYAIRVSRSSRR